MENWSEVKPANKFGRAVIFAVLFIMPVVSLFYLYQGRAHSRTAVAELEKLGNLPGFNIKNQQNQPIDNKLLRGKVTVIDFLPKELEKAKSFADRISKLHQSFDDTDDVIFLSFIVADSSTTLLETASKLGIEDHRQWYLLGTNQANWDSLSNSIFSNTKNVDANLGVAMADTSLQIRKYYDINDNKQMGRMVEHIAKVIPKQKRR